MFISIRKKRTQSSDACFVLSTVLKICIQFVQALNYAVDQGFVHRDMHGNNFMINEDLELKMIDLASFEH
ncbi:MAG: protein kinase [Chlamydiales bacterium]